MADKPHPDAPCDGAPNGGCTNEVWYECECPRCGQEPDVTERFHSCRDHEAEATKAHYRLRKREAYWVGINGHVWCRRFLG